MWRPGIYRESFEGQASSSDLTLPCPSFPSGAESRNKHNLASSCQANTMSAFLDLIVHILSATLSFLFDCLSDS